VGVDDRLVLTEEFGWSDIATKTPLTVVSLLRIGSVSKLLTAAAAVRLVAKGRLDLDAPVGRYLPDVPADKTTLTARQLAGHLGGIRHYGRNEYFNTRPFSNVSETIEIFLRDSLLSPPGNKQLYSSYGFNLLGSVIQAASGNEFREIVRTEVTEPLGMKSTMVEASLPRGMRPAGFYVKSQGALHVAPGVDLSDRWPSGGYLSTASDLVRFGLGILDASYLSDDLRRQLFTPQATSLGMVTNVGLAWRVALDSAGRRFVHHGGETTGGRAFLLVYPEERVVVVLLANQSSAGFREHEAGKIARLFLP
jgi:CubicO group peptidase (beta-lactamase class C family)